MEKSTVATERFDEKNMERRSYWLKKLSGEHDLTGLMPDKRSSAGQGRKEEVHEVSWTGALYDKLVRLTQEKDFLLYTLLMTGLNLCLYKYTGQKRIIVGSPALKNRESSKECNALAIVSEIEGTLTFRELLMNVRQTLLESYQRQDYPYAQLLTDLGLDSTGQRCPLFSIALALSDIHTDLPEVNNDLTILFKKENGGIRGSFIFDAEKYHTETVARFAKHFINILQNAVENTTATVHDLNILSPEEMDLLLNRWNDNRVAYPWDKCVHQLFEEQVAKTPEAVAVVFGEKTLTYRELNERSNQLAHRLRSMGVGPDRLAAICMEPSLEMMVGLFGILKAGGAYIPIDPNYPKDRIQFMLQDANPVVLLTKERWGKLFEENELPIIGLDADWDTISGEETSSPETTGITSGNLAYIIYTSGSTGQPKGAGVYQRGWVNLLNWFITEFAISAQDKVLLISSFSFDLTQKNLFAPLLVGGELHLPVTDYYDPALILNDIGEKQITLLNCTPSAFYPLVEDECKESLVKLASLRCVFLGGENIDMSRMEKWLKSGYCRAEIANTYGPTECTDICGFYRIQEPAGFHGDTVPVGRPIYNARLYILTPENDLAPIGAPGELCVAGDGVGAGYINDPEMTAEKFIPDPVGAPGDRLYKTGDLAYYRPDGNIVFLGRVDHQIKIRGFRIELGEIESAVKSHPGVQEAVVLVRESNSGDQRLVAYLTPDPEQAFVVKNILALENAGTLNRKDLYELPNTMSISHLNKSETEFVYREIFEEHSYFQHGVALEEGSTVLDIGANIGMFTLYVGLRYKNTKIYAFEPIDPIYEVLQNNVRLYNIDAKLFKCGLSEQSKEENITFYPHVSIMSGRYADNEEDHENIRAFILHDQALSGKQEGLSVAEIDELVAERLRSETYTCQFKTISQIIAENGINQVDLLKIDVEKSELDILNGIAGSDWLKIHQIVLEIHDIDGRLNQVLSLLESKGFSVTAMKDAKLEDNAIYNLYAVRQRVDHQSSFAQLSPERDLFRVGSSPNRLLEEIKAYLEKILPHYMLPSNYYLLESLPLSPNGKIDREALVGYQVEESGNNTDYIAPDGPVEEVVARIWQEVLDLELVSVEDNFIELGGHSLLATAIISRLRKVFKIDLPILMFFENPTIRSLSSVVEKQLAKAKVEENAG